MLMLGDIRVFDKNCEQADRWEDYYNPSENTPEDALL